MIEPRAVTSRHQQSQVDVVRDLSQLVRWSHVGRYRRWSIPSIQPSFGAHDPIIGQSDRGGTRDRLIDAPTPTATHRLKLRDEWVIPTGDGCLFVPPIPAIAAVLGA